MADSKTGLGTVSTILTIKPDWQRLPSSGFQAGRQMLQDGAGTTAVRTLVLGKLPFSFSYGFTNLSKEAEYDLLEFFYNRKGMFDRFWLPVWFNILPVIQYVPESGDPYVFRNTFKPFGLYGLDFLDIYQGYERLFVEMNDGDIITRKITDCHADEITPENLVCDTDTNFDRDAALSDIKIFTLLKLCRFDQDELEINHISGKISSCELSFKELTKEYADMDVSTTPIQNTFSVSSTGNYQESFASGSPALQNRG